MDWLASLLLIPVAFPMALGFVNMCCPIVAAGCTGACGDGGAPANMQVVVTGVADSRCPNCEMFNATYTLAKQADPADGCRWLFQYECGNGASPVFDLCTAVNLQDTCEIEVKQFDSTTGPYRLYCRIKDSIIFGGETTWFNAVFIDDKGSRPECTDYTAETPALSTSYDTGACDGSAAAVSITAL